MLKKYNILTNLKSQPPITSLNPVVVTQVREKGHLTRPRLRNPYWFVRKERLVRKKYEKFNVAGKY